MREYTVWSCPECGEQVTKRGHFHDPPEGWWTDDGPGPENIHGEDPWVDAVSATAIDDRDVMPLVQAVRETLCDEAPCSRCDHLRAALKPFEAKEKHNA